VRRSVEDRGVTTPAEPKLCKLQDAAGRVEACPGGACPFWEPGGAALDGRCAVGHLDLAARPELAASLLRIRKELELPDSGATEDHARRLFYLLGTGAGRHSNQITTRKEGSP
jgi:hypothetical protein